jgi:hypothetical protein
MRLSKYSSRSGIRGGSAIPAFGYGRFTDLGNGDLSFHFLILLELSVQILT